MLFNHVHLLLYLIMFSLKIMFFCFFMCFFPTSGCVFMLPDVSAVLFVGHALFFLDLVVK